MGPRRTTPRGANAVPALALALVLALALALTLTATRADAVSLDYRGAVLSERQVASLVAPALRSPGDSAAVRTSLGRLVARLQDDGFLDARADASWAGGAAPLRVEVTEGAHHRLARVEFRGLVPGDSALAKALELPSGGAASGSAIAAAMNRAVDAAAESGHPYARVWLSGWDRDSTGERVVIGGSLGPEISVLGLRFEGLRQTSPKLLERAAGPVRGRYRESAALAARDRIERLGLFRSVRLEDPEGAGDFETARLVLRVEERPYNRFEGVVGSQGDGGVVGLAHVELENLAGTGRAAAVRWEGRGHGVATFTARYAEPLVLGLPLALEGTFDQQLFDTLYTSTKGRLAARWTGSSAAVIETGVAAERVVQEHADVQQANTQSTWLAVGRDRLDDAVAPRAGYAFRLEASQSFTTERRLDGSRDTPRSSAAEATVTRLQRLGLRSGFALEVRSAGRFGSRRVLPLYERYALGGAASLRGYDEEAFRVDRYALSRLEWRWFLPARQYAFLFWDHAEATTRVATLTGDRLDARHQDGIGFGVSLAASSGRLALTYGLAPGRGASEGKVHVRLISPF